MSSITQAKAEAQKLIKRYNKLQAEARTADSAAEAARKASEAEKLVSQISSLQAAISKLQAKDKEEREAVAKKVKSPTAPPALNEQEIKKVEEEKTLLESRIARIEDAQKRTRAQIDQLNRAKAELARLKTEAEQNVARERSASDARLQQEIAKLIKKKELEQQDLKQELDLIREQARKESELLKAQRDAARAMMEKQQQQEREKLKALRSRRAKKGLWIGVIATVVGLILMVIVALVTPMLDNAPVIGPIVTSIKRSWATATPPPPVEVVARPVTPEPVAQKPEAPVEPAAEPLKALKMYRDPLKSGGQGPLMLKLPEGTFSMGAKDSSPYGDEKPQHKVSLQGFSISAYEITFDEYDAFASATERAFPKDNNWGRGNHPVINVSYDDAVEYTKWLTEQTGYQYRLPSEREWEYAAAAGTKTDYWWGYKVDRNRANCGVCGSQWDGQQTAPVGSFQPNSAGLYDTIGNVLEWTSSCYRSSYQGAPSFGNNWEGGDCSKRVVRSSSFRTSESGLRTTKRERYSPGSRIDTLGFRVVRVD